MNKKYLIFGIVFCLLIVPFTEAVLTREKLGQGGANNINIGYSKSASDYWQGAQSFSLNGTGQYNISNVNFTLQKVGSPTDKLFVRIEHNTTSNTPNIVNYTVTNGISNAIAGSSLTTSMAHYQFSFNTSPILNKSQGYWFVVQRTGSVSSTNYFNIRRNSVTQTYTEGKVLALQAYVWNAFSHDFEGAFYYTTYSAPAGSDTCTYSGTGNWIMTNNCNISTSVKLQTGYALILKGTEKTLKMSGSGLIR
jgi:hypothetical protein